MQNTQPPPTYDNPYAVNPYGPNPYAPPPPPPQPPLAPDPDPLRREGYPIAIGIAVGSMVLLLVCGILGSLGLGELGRFATAGLQYAPFIPLIVLAQIGQREVWATALTYIYGLILQACIGLNAFASITAGLGVLNTTTAQGGFDTAKAGQIVVALLMLFVLFLVSSAVLIPQVRLALKRVLPIDPNRLTHTMALWLVLFSTLIAFAQLIYLGGKPSLLTLVQDSPDTAQLSGLMGGTDLQQMLLLVYGFVWLLPTALLAAGWPLRRNFSDTLKRLGFVRPTRQQLLIGFGGAFLLIIGAGLIDFGIGTIWDLMGWPRTDSEAFNKLLGGAISIPGAFVIGITAGIGEEAAMRGLLQPRLGLILSNLAFTSLHAFQYGFDAVLSVFIIGIVLGVVRARTNTSTSAIMHGTYDTISVLLTYFALGV